MVPPPSPPPSVPFHSTSAASPFCYICVTLFYFSYFSDFVDVLFYLAPPFGSSVSVLFCVGCVTSLTHLLGMGLLLVFFSSLALCLYPLLVFLPSVRSSGDVLLLVHQLDISQQELIVAANNNLVLGTLGLRPERMFVSFFFVSCSPLFFSLCSLFVVFLASVFCPSASFFLSFFRMDRNSSSRDIYAPGVIWLQVMRDGIPRFVVDININNAVSLTDWCDAAVRTITCWFACSHGHAFLLRPVL